MRERKITSEDVARRGRVCAMARERPGEALQVARSIAHPWYKCQSLAAVAEHLADRDHAKRLALEALAVAQTEADINRIVTVSAWPLRVLARISPGDARTHLVSLVAQAEEEPHFLRRADALLAVTAAMHGKGDLSGIGMPPLIHALLHGYGWRIERLIRHTILLIGDSDKRLVSRLLDHHAENGKKRRFLRELGNANRGQPAPG